MTLKISHSFLLIAFIFKIGYADISATPSRPATIDSLIQLTQIYPYYASPYTDSIGMVETDKSQPLSLKWKKNLRLGEVHPERNLLTIPVKIAYRADISEKSISIIISYKYKEVKYHTLLNYDNALHLTETLQLGFEGEVGAYFRGIAKIDKNQIQIIHKLMAHGKVGSSHYYYVIGPGGAIAEQSFEDPIQLIAEGKLRGVRAVKALSGLNVRDESENIVTSIPYGTEVYILDYKPEIVTINDDGKKIVGRWAKVVLDLDEYRMHLAMPSIKLTTFYVFDGFLYKGGGFINHNRGDLITDKNDTGYYYNSNFVRLKPRTNPIWDIDLREFMDIERVSLSSYKSQIISSQEIQDSLYTWEGNNRFTLEFNDGSRSEFRDSTYEDYEYSPTNHHEIFKKHSFGNNYLIFNSFFESSQFLLLSKSNGDTLAYFEGYPFASPGNKLIVSFKSPPSYGEGTVIMEVQRFQKKKIKYSFSTEFINWNIPKDQVIYWLSDNEFILKVKEVERMYSDEENAEFYFLKFRFKD